MTTNEDLAEVFRGIADLLDLAGEKFKPEAYRRAARSIESLPEDIRQIAGRDELDSVPGVGEAIAEKIREYLRDGKVPYYERLRLETPPGVLEIMRLPGVGPKTARRFLIEFGIEGPAELTAAINEGRFRDVKGFGERKIELLRQAVAAGAPSSARMTLLEAWQTAERLIGDLKQRAPVEQIAAAGSLRRRRESVGDLDLLVTSAQPEAVFDALSALPGVSEVKLRGPTKETVVLDGRLQVDLRVVEPAAFGAALQYFTGSKDHNIHLRTIARDRGLRINEYGVFRGEERLTGTTEEEVYRTLDLPWIPPEIRENHGEIEAATAGQLPTLVAPPDLSGDLHVHLTPASGPSSVRDRLDAAARLGWSAVGFILPSPPDRLSAEVTELLDASRSPSPGRPVALRGVEQPLDRLAPAHDVDFRIAEASHLRLPPAPLSRSPEPPLFVAHRSRPPGRSEATPEETNAWVAWARASRVALEVSPAGAADGLDSAGVRRAVESKVALHLTAGIRSDSDSLAPIELAVGLARRGWASPASVLRVPSGTGRSTRTTTR